MAVKILRSRSALQKVRDNFSRRFGSLPTALEERIKETEDMDRLLACLEETYQARDRAEAEASLLRLFTTH